MPRVFPVVIQPRARREIEEAVAWLSQWSPTMAAKWVDGLTKALVALGTDPDSYPLAPESNWCPWVIRQRLYGKKRNIYRILFTIEADQVSVLSVYHASRDNWRP